MCIIMDEAELWTYSMCHIPIYKVSAWTSWAGVTRRLTGANMSSAHWLLVSCIVKLVSAHRVHWAGRCARDLLHRKYWDFVRSSRTCKYRLPHWSWGCILEAAAASLKLRLTHWSCGCPIQAATASLKLRLRGCLIKAAAASFTPRLPHSSCGCLIQVAAASFKLRMPHSSRCCLMEDTYSSLKFRRLPRWSFRGCLIEAAPAASLKLRQLHASLKLRRLPHLIGDCIIDAATPPIWCRGCRLIEITAASGDVRTVRCWGNKLGY